MDDCLDDKRMKLSSNFLLRSFPDFSNQSKLKIKLQNKTKKKKGIFSLFSSKKQIAFKYPVHSNGYVSVPTTNGNQSSSFTHSFGYSAFAPTLPLHFAHNHPSPYLLGDSRATRLNEANYKSSSVAASSSSSSSTSSSSSSYRPLASSKS